jgi:hypothetical protein
MRPLTSPSPRVIIDGSQMKFAGCPPGVPRDFCGTRGGSRTAVEAESA